jgi:deoxycytidine triphosphate deaminase
LINLSYKIKQVLNIDIDVLVSTNLDSTLFGVGRYLNVTSFVPIFGHYVALGWVSSSNIEFL